MIDGHGGNIYQLAGQLGCEPADISDMSANVNPLGPMPALVTFLKKEIQAISSLPEVNAGEIVRSFSRFYHVDPGQVMAGNGTTELIYLIPRAINPGKTLVVGPTYADYRDSCTINRVPCDQWTSKETHVFVPDLDAVKKAARLADLVFLCNPNNPTGAMVSRQDLTALCRSLPDTLFVIDESYLPFVPEPEDVTLIGAGLPNVMILNSMSKAFRIPGLRIGFVSAPKTILKKLTPYALPWSVNGMAQKAVSWLMNHANAVNRFLEQTRSLVASERGTFIARLEKETRIRCFPSVTSYVLMALPRGLDAPTVWKDMAQNRILIRDCSNFTGLSERFIRISLKKEPENRKAADLLIQLFREYADAR